jgi:hypothetical protein
MSMLLGASGNWHRSQNIALVEAVDSQMPYSSIPIGWPHGSAFG